MAGVLVDVLLERLATRAFEKIERELKLVVGVEQGIKDLIKKLKAIQAVLEDAEQRQVTEASVKNWLNELKDVSFDMDDVIDEWITRVEKHQLEKQEKQQKKKVCFPFPSSCFFFGQVDYKLLLRREIAVKVKELNERLDDIHENKQRFNFQNTPRAVPELFQRRKTTSLPNVKTFGRDFEKNLIVSKLLSESSEGNEVPLIIPIVGMGGMGKTYLANLVYNDDKIKSQFGKRIWVCVSYPFDEIQVARAILESLGKDSTSKELETLMKSISDSIVGKKFLLVLDDVWSQNSDWEELIKPLRRGAMGSKVLVTTRDEKVANLMNATTQVISLKELSEPFCLSLFYYNAGKDESSVSEEFHNIGLEVVKRCNGLPLAAKTLGSLMRSKENIHEWQLVLKSKIWDLKEIQNDVFRPLLLSYHDLDPRVKCCLLYCVIFSKSYELDRNTLIELWMSQDYIKGKDSKAKIEVGRNYFDNLVKRSFFQDIEEHGKSGNITCKIHDIVHECLQYLTEKECLILKDDETGKISKDDKYLHLSLVRTTTTAMDRLRPFILSCSKLRTLAFIHSETNFTSPIWELIVQLKCLRTLILRFIWGVSLVEIPETIGQLIHLRYLDLSGNDELKELPSAVGGLYNLQTLRLAQCCKLKIVDVRRLINLRHLYVDGCGSLELIDGLEKLTDVQTLDFFPVGAGDNEGNKLEVLKDLNQLEGSLSIQINVLKSAPKARFKAQKARGAAATESAFQSERRGAQGAEEGL